MLDHPDLADQWECLAVQEQLVLVARLAQLDS